MENIQKKLNDMNGMELLTCVIEGRCPAPTMAVTMPMAIESVEEGQAVFSAMAGNQRNCLAPFMSGFVPQPNLRETAHCRVEERNPTMWHPSLISQQHGPVTEA